MAQIKGKHPKQSPWTKPPRFRGREAPGSNPGPRPASKFNLIAAGAFNATKSSNRCNRSRRLGAVLVL